MSLDPGFTIHRMHVRNKMAGCKKKWYRYHFFWLDYFLPTEREGRDFLTMESLLSEVPASAWTRSLVGVLAAEPGADPGFQRRGCVLKTRYIHKKKLNFLYEKK